MADKYVTDMNGAELRAHMKRLKAMAGWHDPLSDSLYAEIQRMDAERSSTPPRQMVADSEQAETEQSIAADCYHWIAERIGTRDGYSVQDHIDAMCNVLDECADYFHDFSGSDVGGDDEGVRIAANLRALKASKLEDVADAPGMVADSAGGASKEYRRGLMEAFHYVNMMNANRRGRTAEETCAYIVRELAAFANGGQQAPADGASPAALTGIQRYKHGFPDMDEADDGSWVLLSDVEDALAAQPPAAAEAERDAERLDWLLWKLPGDAIRHCVGELSDTADGAEFRAAIDRAERERPTQAPEKSDE